MVLLIVFVCVCLASLPGHEGLDLMVSGPGPYHPLGSNVTIYCTDQSSDDLDWLKGEQGQSHLSACSLTRSCLPSGQKYTVDPKNRLFNMNLYNLKYSDCGRYWCKNFEDRQSYKLELIEKVNHIDKQESDGTLSITTNCVLPTFTVDIQWYYTYKDGPPRIYEKPATRIEERDRCQGACEGNNAMNISSTLTPPIGGNNVIPVKFMAYVRQGDDVQKVTFSKEYLIQGCDASPIWHVVVFIMVPAIICCFCNVCLTILHIRERKPPKDIVSTLIVMWICLVILICFGIHLAIEEEPTVQDAFGTCHDNYSAKVIVVEVCGILIMVGLITETIYSCCNKWKKVTIKFQRTQPERELKMEGDKGEGTDLLPQGPESDVDTGMKTPHGSSTPEEDTEKIKRQIAEERKKEEERIKMKKKSECDVGLPCMPVVRNKDEQYVDLSGTALLQCSLETDANDYPSWQGPAGKLINYGAEREFKVKDRFNWHADKKSIIINRVQECDAGKYVCFSSKGAVRTVDLIIRLPSEPVEANSLETTTLKIGPEKMIRHYPLWRRWNNLNAELHKELFVDNIAWDADNKGLVIKNITRRDEGEYEVYANHLVKRFALSVKTQSGSDQEQTVEEGKTVRLESSGTIDYFPSWECIESGIHNIAGEQHFQSGNRGDAYKRFGWSVDKRSLVIKEIILDDTGTYVCRHSDGTIESVVLIVRGNGRAKKSKKMTLGMKKAYRIHHESGIKLPSLKLVTRNGDEVNKTDLAYQNYKTDKYNSDDTREGIVFIENPSRLTDVKVESSTFRGKIKVYQLLDLDENK